MSAASAPAPRNPAFAQGETDTYNGTSVWYWVLHVMLVIYALGYLASLAISLNTVVPHTYFKANQNGVLYSDRYNSAYWLATFFSAFRLFVFLVLCSMILYRNTRCCGRYGGCTVFWIVLLVGLVLLELFNFTILTNFFVKCNGVDQVDNPCNDLLWCCVPSVFANPSNLCSNTIACAPLTGSGAPTPTSLDQLKPNTDFIWMFSVSTVFMVFDAFFLLLPIGLWLVNSASSTFMGGGGGEETCRKDLVVDDFLGTQINGGGGGMAKRRPPKKVGIESDLVSPLIEKMEERKIQHEPKMTKQP